MFDEILPNILIITIAPQYHKYDILFKKYSSDLFLQNVCSNLFNTTNQNLSGHCGTFLVSQFMGCHSQIFSEILLSWVLLSGCRANMDTLLQENPTGTFTAGTGATRQPETTGELWHISKSQHKLWKDGRHYAQHWRTSTGHRHGLFS